MKSSGVLATLMLAAVAGYASAQCTDAETLVTDATGKGTCDGLTSMTDDAGTTTCIQDMTVGTCTASQCASGATTVTPGVCTANKFVYSTDGTTNYDCVLTEPTDGATKVRTVACKTLGGATVADSECTGTAPSGADLTKDCAAIPNTCANAVSAGSAFVCSTHATLKTQKAGATACAVTSGVPDTCVAADCCELPACTASADTAKDGTGDGAFYCINGGTIAGAAGSCTCGSCNTGYSGANCATAATCTAVDTPMAGCVVPDCTAADTPYAGCTVLACTAADTPWVGCTAPACTSSAILPWEPCTPKACTAVDTPWVGCTPPACTAVDTPYAGCTPPACTAVDTPYAGCTTPDCTDTDTPYAGCTAVTCAKDKSVTSKACVACATGKVNAAGDDQFGADTTCTTKPAPAAAASGAATAAVSLTALLALVLA